MNGKQFQRYLDRDGGCVHCGDVETAVPHHRLNRGMGGSKVRDVPSNIISMCSHFNGQMESNAVAAAYAVRNGWKLRSGDNPSTTPFWHARRRVWLILDNNYGYREETNAID